MSEVSSAAHTHIDYDREREEGREGGRERKVERGRQKERQRERLVLEVAVNESLQCKKMQVNQVV